MSRSKYVAEMAEAVERVGGSLQVTAKGHLRVTGPLGVAFVGSAPKRGAALRKAVADIRRYAGLELS